MCSAPLKAISRIPVCRACLEEPAPLLADYFCICCRTPFLNSYPLDDEGRCGLCRSGLSAFDGAYSFGSHDGTLRELVNLFKYGRVYTLAGPLGGYLALALPRDVRFDVIVPMPLHWRRRLSRGFNQSELLARVLSRRTGIPVGCVVRRRRATSAQAGLSGHARRANVAGAFCVKRRVSLQGLRLLLVDDVFTTGATARACAAVLKRAGAGHVSVLTVSRADRRMHAGWSKKDAAMAARAG